MTSEEVQNMKAGREMDALIAEKVTRLSYILYDGTDKDADELTPNYSTDISAAWEVVKKVVGFNESNDFELITTVSGWKCIFSDAHAEYKARGETAHEAICKAALMTVCGKV